jgi:uncharacterized membrane protein YbaN (DUF454 family)
MQNIKRTLYITGGFLCVILAFIGIFVPLMPTTAFLLLAAFLFSRSSKRALHWLEYNRLFGKYIRDYRAGRGIPLPQKIITLAILWISILLTIIYAIENHWVEILLLGVAVGVTIHLARLKTYQPEI